jgi:hypothetical protein
MMTARCSPPLAELAPRLRKALPEMTVSTPPVPPSQRLAITCPDGRQRRENGLLLIETQNHVQGLKTIEKAH